MQWEYDSSKVLVCCGDNKVGFLCETKPSMIITITERYSIKSGAISNL